MCMVPPRNVVDVPDWGTAYAVTVTVTVTVTATATLHRRGRALAEPGAASGRDVAHRGRHPGSAHSASPRRSVRAKGPYRAARCPPHCRHDPTVACRYPAGVDTGADRRHAARRSPDRRRRRGDDVRDALAAVSFTLPLVLALVGWWWRSREADAAASSVRQDHALDRLADVMGETWATEAAARGIVVPAPVRVRWRWDAGLGAARDEAGVRAAAGVGPRVLPPDGAADDGGPLLESGVVTRLHDELYARLPRGRLVLVGGPGAGKTGAMILTMLAALDHRRATAADRRRDVPVPVWLTLGDWDPVATPLADWAAATLTRDHPYLRAAEYGPDVAGGLLRDGRLALFLDGLDELPDAVRGAALRRLEREAAGLRVVVSSRPDEFAAAQAEGRLHGAAVVQVRPVRARAAADYLVRDQPPRLRDAWTAVRSAMAAEPDGVLARTLDNPLMLSLARATYRNGDPAELARPGRFASVSHLREHLVDQVLVSAYPEPGERERVTDRLGWVAHHLGDDRNVAWWRIPDWVPPRRRRIRRISGDAVVGGTAALLMLRPGVADDLRLADVAYFAGAGSLVGVATGALAGVARRPAGGGGPVRLRPRRPGPADVALVGAAFVTSWLLATIVFLALPILTAMTELVLTSRDGALRAVWTDDIGGVGGLWGFAAVALPVGIVVALVALWSVPAGDAPAATPQRVYRDDRRAWLLVALVLAPAVTLLVAGTAVAASSETMSPALAWAALAGGAGAGFIIGSRIGQVPALLLVEGFARQPRIVPVLHDACRRGVLRQAGAFWQFRHAELQNRLAGRYREAHGLGPACAGV
jgi:hypothetical protein